MHDTITLTGLVATQPRHVIASENLPITTFRLASTHRRFDRGEQRWIDGDTNWYTIAAFRQLATNLSVSLSKGDRVVVTGRLKIKNWESSDKTGTTVEIEADAIGHDLTWGTARYARTMSSSSGSSTPDAPSEARADSASAEAPSSDADRDEVPAPF